MQKMKQSLLKTSTITNKLEMYENGIYKWKYNGEKKGSDC